MVLYFKANVKIWCCISKQMLRHGVIFQNKCQDMTLYLKQMSIHIINRFSDPAMLRSQRSWQIENAPRASRFPTVAAKKITATDFSRNSSKLICIIACGTSAPPTPYTALGKVKMTYATPRYGFHLYFFLDKNRAK